MPNNEIQTFLRRFLPPLDWCLRLREGGFPQTTPGFFYNIDTGKAYFIRRRSDHTYYRIDLLGFVEFLTESEFREKYVKAPTMSDIFQWDKLREALADLEHEQWMHWAEAVIQSENISQERRRRWQQYFVPYQELAENVKDFDREWADKVIAIIQEFITGDISGNSKDGDSHDN